MNNKKGISIILASLTIISCFTACGSEESSKVKKVYSDEGNKGAGIKGFNEMLEGADDFNANAGADIADDFDINAEVNIDSAELNKGDASMDNFGIVKEEALGIVEGGCVVDIPEPENTIEADSMILTAGRWNDLNNWGFFTNLVNSDTITFPSFGLNPCNMLEVTLTNLVGEPLQGRLVELVTPEGEKVWSAYSDKDGKAHLFKYDKYTEMKVLTYKNENDYEEQVVGASSNSGQQGGNVDNSSKISIELDTESVKNDSMQIMFIVDTTGSMGDELTFLQKDFSSIMNEVGTDDIEYSVNFYRDVDDDYITKCNSFSRDVAEIQSLLNAEAAGGGGDTPEAVAEILNETMNSPEWIEDTTKLVFMIFDAPPHDDKNTEIEASIREATSKGIHIIPVVSSNSERETELFGRALAIMTNGEYVFLTDDSGVGDSHLEPIIGDYEVQKLHDIIIDIINEYK